MSQLNPKRQTLMQRFGYHDADLTTPAHDHLIFWVKENINQVLVDFYPLPTWDPSSYEAFRIRAKEMIAARVEILKKWKEEDQQWVKRLNKSEYSSEIERGQKLLEKLPLYDREIARLKQLPGLSEPPAPAIELTELPRDECPIGMGDRNNSIVGFLDIVVRCHVPTGLLIAGGKTSDSDYGRHITEWRDVEWSISYKEHLLGFEIKTTIPSYGELMRQINTYRRYFHGELVVVSPDTRFAEQIKSQGVRFVEYRGELPQSRPRQESLL